MKLLIGRCVPKGFLSFIFSEMVMSISVWYLTLIDVHNRNSLLEMSISYRVAGNPAGCEMQWLNCYEESLF